MQDSIRFAHLADIHLGAFREKKLKELNSNQFIKTIDTLISNKYDFILISGDIFNVPLPPLDIVDLVIQQMNRLKELHIPVFVIGGSHDYSLTHKSFIELLDAAGVWKNVGNWQSKDHNEIELLPTTIQLKNVEINLYGVLGKKNGLDNKIYSKLHTKKNHTSQSFDIFMFHTSITELLPNHLQKVDEKVGFAYSLNTLPKGFNYYAGGHIHHPTIQKFEANSNTSYVSYSGPIFPNSFSELKDKFSGFIEGEIDTETKEFKQEPKYIPLELKKISLISLNCEQLTPENINSKLIEKISKIELGDSIILLELYGEIKGKINSININQIIESLYEKGAFIVLKNTSKLSNENISHEKLETSFQSLEELHEKAISTYIKDKKELAHQLLQLDVKKHEDETNHHYEERVVSMIQKTIKN